MPEDEPAMTKIRVRRSGARATACAPPEPATPLRHTVSRTRSRPKSHLPSSPRSHFRLGGTKGDPKKGINLGGVQRQQAHMRAVSTGEPSEAEGEHRNETAEQRNKQTAFLQQKIANRKFEDPCNSNLRRAKNLRPHPKTHCVPAAQRPNSHSAGRACSHKTEFIIVDQVKERTKSGKKKRGTGPKSPSSNSSPDPTFDPAKP
ncbi:hypothetical protein K438DRAFT_1788961 [Mycena galopus ATCC 62051]|nr:hypothetical protein K438DRAFT_1788961 [Mycena galopus ATCC 62051]